MPNSTYLLGSRTEVTCANDHIRSFESGQLQFERYSHLVTTSLPFIRASGMQRVIDTAGNWSLGMSRHTRYPHLFSTMIQASYLPLLNPIILTSRLMLPFLFR